jgi:hypothetical protein
MRNFFTSSGTLKADGYQNRQKNRLQGKNNNNNLNLKKVFVLS